MKEPIKNKENRRSRAPYIKNTYTIIVQSHVEGNVMCVYTPKQIFNCSDLEDAKSRSLDNLGRVYARTGDYDDAIQV